MSFKDFVSSHTGRQFFDTFREFVSAFTKYTRYLTLLGDMMESQMQQRVAQFQAEVNAVDDVVDNVDIDRVPSEMPCIVCDAACSPALNVLIGWRGAVGLLCVDCAAEKGLIDDVQRAN